MVLRLAEPSVSSSRNQLVRTGLLGPGNSAFLPGRRRYPPRGSGRRTDDYLVREDYQREHGPLAGSGAAGSRGTGGRAAQRPTEHATPPGQSPPDPAGPATP